MRHRGGTGAPSAISGTPKVSGGGVPPVDVIGRDNIGPVPSPDVRQRLAQERQRIEQQAQALAGRFQRAWDLERKVRLLREQQLHLYASGEPNPKTIRRIEETIKSLEKKYKPGSDGGAQSERPRIREQDDGSPAPPSLQSKGDPFAAKEPAKPMQSQDSSSQRPLQEQSAPFPNLPLAPGGRGMKGEGELTSLIPLLRLELEVLGYDPSDPLFANWQFVDFTDGIVKILRAMGRIAERKAQERANEARRHAIEEETQAWIGFSGNANRNRDSGSGDYLPDPDRALRDAFFR